MTSRVWPFAAAMWCGAPASHHALHHCQAQAGAVLARAEEGSDSALQQLLGKARTVVRHGDAGALAVGIGRALDYDTASVVGHGGGGVEDQVE